MDWNYRIGTTKIKNIWYGSDGPEGENHFHQVYYIIKCFYIENDTIPFNFTKVSLTEVPDLKTLQWELDEMQKVFDSPILDMDNFPNEYV